MRYGFIEAHKGTWPVHLMCDVLNVSRSGYYGWRGRAPGQRAQANAELEQRIVELFHRHRQRYGAPRITDDLREAGFSCSENRVARRMQALGLKAVQAKPYKVTTDSTHKRAVAPDLIEQDFGADGLNQKWVSDISYVRTDEGWLYLAVVMDLYSRAIIGWAMRPRMTQHLVCDALTMALFRRRFPKRTIIHSDRGSQYCSKRYQRLIRSNGLRCSMGRKGNCYDNAAMESFFHTLKVELIHREHYTTRREAKSHIFEYIETYYNRKRKHSAIGYRIPILFEEQSA